MRRVIVSLLCLAMISMIVCQPAWNRVNQGQLTEDMRTLFQRYGCSGSFRSVQMVGTTRIGRVVINITKDEIDSFIQGLELSLITDRGALPITFIKRVADLEEIGSKGITVSDIKTFGLFGRNKNLRISDHSSFDYIILVYDMKQNIAFIEVEYSYG